ncbi:hypothetical protein AAMO2058_001506100 [Amorphochlora amoebiformis]
MRSSTSPIRPHPVAPPPKFLPRRVVPWLATSLALAVSNGGKTYADSGGGRVVVGGKGYASISAALEGVYGGGGGVVEVFGGVWRERVVIRGGVRIEGKEGATIIHETEAPYESTISLDISPKDNTPASISGLKIRHSSPSVASNYAVRVDSGSLEISDCDISSTTGSAIGTEGGLVYVSRSVLSSAKRHGIALFPPLDPDGPPVLSEISDSVIASNGLSGISVRGDNVEVKVTRCIVEGNQQYGISATGGGFAEVDSCTIVRGNGKGSLLEELGGAVVVRRSGK